MDFFYSNEQDYHNIRRKQMLIKYPKKIRPLMKNNPWSFLFVIALMFSQLAIAYSVSDLSFDWVLLCAWVFGAFFNHALYVFVHEASHNLIFKTTFANRLVGILCDVVLVFPGAQAFRKFHIHHHNHMGEFEWDADICSRHEADLIKNNRFKKFIWMFLFGISQAMRPSRLTKVKLWDKWVVLNFITQMCANILIFYFLGSYGLIYLISSTIFALGLHPLGGRWIAEHYITDQRQETYSYYGLVNKVMFNIGYHTEHHDFMNIPWNQLPKLHSIGKKEFYDIQSHYKSYTKILLRFIWDKRLSPYSRVIRESK